MRIYDKTTWQKDAGVIKDIISDHFKLLFTWLKNKGLLNDEGLEIYDLASFSDTSLHEGLLTERGNAFISKIYDELLKTASYGSYEVTEFLNKHYS